MYRVKSVKYVSEYKLKIQFTNGKIKVADLAGTLKNAKNLFIQLKDLEYFKQVECDGYSICWPNGIDFCPDLLYKMGKDIPKEKRKSVKSPKKKISRQKKSSSV